MAAMTLKGAIKRGLRTTGLLPGPVPVPPGGTPAPQIKEIADNFLTWVRFAVAGHPSAGNPYCFDHAVRHMPPGGRMVEIGSFAGLSAVQIGYLARRHGRAEGLVCCDPWMFEGAPLGVTYPGTGVTTDAYRVFVRETFARNVRFFCDGSPPSAVEAYSDDFFDAWRRGESRPDVVAGGVVRLGGPVSFCFIDGNHTYEAATRDFRNADEFLLPGGFVLFDDSGDGQAGPDGIEWGSCRAAREVTATGRYELVMKNPHYLFRKK